MPFYIFSDLKEKRLNHFEVEQYCKDHNVTVLHQYISNNPKVQYRYVFEDGKEFEFNTIQAKIYESAFGKKIVSGGPLNYLKKDIYQGFNHGLGMEVRGRDHHKQLLKEKGLVEVGNERPVQSIPDVNKISDQQIKAAIDMGADIGGVAINAIKEGVKLHVD